MAKEKQINLRISEQEKKVLEQDALKEARSVSNLLLWCWKQWRGNNRQRRK
jgi:uncharacterized protein (DUF1778 family)